MRTFRLFFLLCIITPLLYAAPPGMSSREFILRFYGTKRETQEDLVNLQKNTPGNEDPIKKHKNAVDKTQSDLSLAINSVSQEIDGSSADSGKTLAEKIDAQRKRLKPTSGVHPYKPQQRRC